MSSSSSTTDHRSYQPIKPAASRMLAKRWDDKAYSQHKTKLAKAKPTIDTRPPKTYVHLHLKLKKLQVTSRVPRAVCCEIEMYIHSGAPIHAHKPKSLATSAICAAAATTTATLLPVCLAARASVVA